MSEPKLISPLLDGFLMGDPISDHHGVRCCPAMRADTEEKYLVKIISVPASQTQLDALLITGAYKNKESANIYFEQLTQEVEAEAKTLKELSQLEGFQAYENWQVVPMEDGTGFDIYLLSPYKRSLERMLRSTPMTHLAAVNLGLDLCAALAVCRRLGYLYVDLKPDNVFVDADRNFRIGDLGFIKRSALKYSSLPEKYRSNWTAPEIADAFSSINETVDIYALGLILYQVYNDGQLPELNQPGYFPPPMYADYEIGEIILRACAPTPEDRWQDPVQMGQALVGYMQRNSINDDPIIPPPAPAEEPEPEPAEEEISSEEAAQETADEVLDETDENTDDSSPVTMSEEDQLSMEDILANADTMADVAYELADIAMNPEDETLPSEAMAEEMTEDGLSDEVSEMLAQADELISHEAPPPVVAPDPVEIPMPEPIVIVKEEPADAESITEEEDTQDPEDDDDSEHALQETKRRPNLLIPVLSLITAVLLIASGILFYQHYYLQEISSLSYVSQRDELTVTLDTDIDEAKLTVVITDTAGNTKRRAVTNGVAHFTGLASGMDYKISVEIDGFHKLTGEITALVTTDQQTKIVTFSAITGTEDGSVLLNFTVDGPETQEWKVQYSAPGEPEREMMFSGHMVSITGLTVGAEYTFRLIPSADLYVTGNSELTYTASKVIIAENIKIAEHTATSFRIMWNAPEGTNVSGWTVRCYNDNGYNKTLTVTDPSALFDALDTTFAHTIEITAQGMAQSTRMYISANPVFVEDLQYDVNTPGVITLNWTFSGKAPEGGWLVLYSIDGSEMQSVVRSDTPAVTITNAIPGATYDFSIQAANGTAVFSGTASLETPEAAHFDSFKLKDTDLTFSMCKTPTKVNWDRRDLKDEDYKTVFAIGEKASFLVHAAKKHGTDRTAVTVLYVIRNADGIYVSSNIQQHQWNQMFVKQYCELDIPVMPSTAGTYNIEIYFNNAFVTSQNFTVQ